jgi:hypothetical protein
MGLRTLLGLRKKKRTREAPDPRRAIQEHEEFDQLVSLFVQHNVRRYLEIGVRSGGSFKSIMRALPVGARGVAVDLPGANWGREGSDALLQQAIEGLRADGYSVSLHLGNSQDPDIVKAVAKEGPFDAAFIDGDHLYEGVAADWYNYGPMARIVAFHDVQGRPGPNRQGLQVEVPRLWQEIKQQYDQTVEFITPGSCMGIGVVFR